MLYFPPAKGKSDVLTLLGLFFNNIFTEFNSAVILKVLF